MTWHPCGCITVTRPGGQLTVPCEAHDTEWWEQ